MSHRLSDSVMLLLNEIVMLSLKKSPVKTYLRRNTFSMSSQNEHNSRKGISWFEKLKNTEQEEAEEFLNGKVALVTGGATGIGLACAEELFRNGLKAIAIVDCNSCRGKEAIVNLTRQYGDDKGIFINCDVCDADQFERAFTKTRETYGRIDLVINNAGIFNDRKWKVQINTNVTGYVIGSLLGLQYMSKSCNGCGGTIVNIASTFGIVPMTGCPLHSMTQHAIIGLSRSLGYGDHFDRTGVRVMALCPGPTDTDLMRWAPQRCLNSFFCREFKEEMEGMPVQQPYHVANALGKMLREGCNGSVWVAQDCETAFEMENMLDHCDITKFNVSQ